MKKDGTHKVVPGLSLKGKDILLRVKNRSLQLDGTGNYLDNQVLADAKALTRLDAAIAAQKNAKTIANLKNKLNGR